MTGEGRGELGAQFDPTVIDGPAQRAFFGDAVAVVGGVVAVGAWGDDGDRGSVQLLEPGDGGWRRSERLVPPDPREGDRFGYALALTRDWLAVGSPNRATRRGERSGAMYLYQRVDGAWRLARTITPPELEAQAYLGTALAASDDLLAVVAGGAGQQTLFVLERSGTGWRRVETIPLAREGVDHEVAIDGDRIVVGARFVDQQRADEASIVVLERTGGGWTRAGGPLLPEDAGPCFGCSVALQGQRMLVGSPAPEGGRAYLYTKQGSAWREVARFTGSGGHDFFGRAVAFAENAVLVGAPGDDRAGDNAGALHTFAEAGEGWRTVSEVTLPGAGGDDSFASKIATGPNMVVAGASGRAGAKGAVYVAPSTQAGDLADGGAR